jgi:hypothetical protein
VCVYSLFQSAKNTRVSIRGKFPQIVDKLVQEVHQSSQAETREMSSSELNVKPGKPLNNLYEREEQQTKTHTKKNPSLYKMTKPNNTTFSFYKSRN